MGVISYLVVGGEILSETRNGVRSDFSRVPTVGPSDMFTAVCQQEGQTALSPFGFANGAAPNGYELSPQAIRPPRGDLSSYVRWLLGFEDCENEQQYRYVEPPIEIGAESYLRLRHPQVESEPEQRN